MPDTGGASSSGGDQPLRDPRNSLENMLTMLPDSRKSLEEMFADLDTDSSGNISKVELEYAMKLKYGKPLKSSAIDKMMKEADADSDGEISLEEFKLLMNACEVDQRESKKNQKTMGLWFSIRERVRKCQRGQ